ncbi:MAG: F0F1 ATP synthase subunit B [Bacilli bacterium]
MAFDTLNLVLGSSTGEAGPFPWGNILVQLFAFIILMFLLKKYAFGPLMKIMKEREETVAKQMDDAEKHFADAQTLIAEQKEITRTLRQDSQAQYEQAKRQAEELKQQIIADARKEADNIKEKAVRDIALERDQAIKQLREEIATISVLVAEKVIHKQLDANDQSELIAKYIQEVGEGR